MSNLFFTYDDLSVVHPIFGGSGEELREFFEFSEVLDLKEFQ